MELKEIHAKLAEKFGDSIGEWVEPDAGDAWVEVLAGAWPQVARHLKGDPALAFDYLKLLTGTDYVEYLEAIYHLFSYTHEHTAAIKIKLDRDNPVVASVMHVWPAADWHERETYDLVGLEFEGHDNLTRILCADDWVGHPLRKDYKQPDEYHGITNW